MATISTTAQNEVGAPSQLPTFVFPARASLSSAPSPFPRTSGRRPMSIPTELPSFSFNQSTTSSASPAISPPVSPCFANFDLSNSPRAAVHRRGTSEFIGGDGKVGSSAGLMSTSPTQGDNVLPPPNPGRRGHAHRRSAAVSAHDIKMILNHNAPNTPSIPRGGSAPTSPSSHENQQAAPGPAKPASSDDASAVKILNRARVGFSANVEFIPRPVSVVSSDTSSTVTMRPTHSVSNSLSSVVSGGTVTPPATLAPPNKNLLALPSPNIRGADSRPRTANAILDPIKDTAQPAETSASQGRRGSMPLLNDIQAIAPPSPRKKWTFFGHEPASGNSSPSRSRPVSSTSIDKAPDTSVSVSSRSSPKVDIADIYQMPSIEPSCSRRSSISRKSGKKQKKVKSWAGSILSRKSRSRGQKKKGSRRSATPPTRPYSAMSDSAALDIQPLPVHAEESPAPEQQDFASWKPRQTYPCDDDAMSPIIDLDAALGPFNTPSSYGAEWESPQKTSSKRRMHSAAGMGGFIGPGMHYHRRTESAPEMVPFENRFGIHRLGSSSTMADVFEEDEEDDEWEDTKASSDKDSLARTEDDDQNALGIDITVVEMEASNSDKIMDWSIDESRGIRRNGSGPSESERKNSSASLKSDHSNTSWKDESNMEEEYISPIEIADDSIPPRPDSGAQSSESTATPPFRPRPAKDLAPVEINPFSLQPAYLIPNSPHSTSHSSFPSPRSPFSYDTQRISTAPSSIADENAFHSLLLGEPGPELRMSVDDVPSLTSSNSTMTRESGANPCYIFRDGQRSVSVSSASGPTRKRSSMASLSRLISTSHGERSKLSIESRVPSSSDMEKKNKGSKSKRISRMIQFWKPKETKEST
ncbi:f285e07e-2d07-4b69-aafa-5b4d491b9876 [Sclerotinia trifoliorum]|uniref:F285e07e-2d07-4b69-aafa-5b4d491b9876 n=1 Tax=Sclerotinia trifoliorum TaxID=28548 RepID=A0A8H2VWG5_9HELO|nr:f285e07e-2d07-4b69-aafa-5b4d491b9876 [Sclerotinia trifoliorum]